MPFNTCLPVRQYNLRATADATQEVGVHQSHLQVHPQERRRPPPPRSPATSSPATPPSSAPSKWTPLSTAFPQPRVGPEIGTPALSGSYLASKKRRTLGPPSRISELVAGPATYRIYWWSHSALNLHARLRRAGLQNSKCRRWCGLRGSALLVLAFSRAETD